jgi:hypothetical protein
VEEIEEARESKLPIHRLSVELGNGEEKIGEGGVLAAGELGDAGGPFACVHGTSVSRDFRASWSARISTME